MVCSAIQVFPAPVGAVTRQSAVFTASTASIWKASGVKGLAVGLPIPAKTVFRLASAPGLIVRIRGFLRTNS